MAKLPPFQHEGQTRNLNFIQRLNIATYVASALHYLHDQCGTTILHCDIRLSNVLDNDMTAHLSDFSLARLLSTTNDLSQTQSVTLGIKYVYHSMASKEGDVYSYGILVLEMFIEKRPTDEVFKNCLNLHSFVGNALPANLLQIVEPNAIPIEVAETTMVDAEERHYNMQSCLVSMLKMGLGCFVESHGDRMNMADVTQELHIIKKDSLNISI
ncbi:hypothetical protein FNV43_RR24632 [Rhamnella rubrinervis]|uniref:Protein kinase domain-containing protein n=1 Tax=Rhamnella rubrinervis TaxID=2594499 RepID=A0A8K0DTG0_9ROSA|nr:hypothetical protein FNV43_RR24632 [Rhamnella rubrinervis]